MNTYGKDYKIINVLKIQDKQKLKEVVTQKYEKVINTESKSA